MRRSVAICASAVLILVNAGAAIADSWDYRVLKDPISDSPRGIATLSGANGTLAIKCDEKGPTSIYVQLISKQYLGKGRYGPRREVITRLDDGTPSKQEWFHDENSALILDNAEAKALSLQFAKSKKLIFRLTNYDYDTIDIVLAGDGNDKAVQQAFETCGQK